MTAGPDDDDRPVDLTLDAAGNTLTAAVTKGGTTDTTTFTVNILDAATVEARHDGATAKATYDPAGNALDRCYWKPSITVGSCLPVGSAGWTNPPTSSTTTAWDARNERIGLADSASNQTTIYDADHNYAPKAIYLPTKADLTKEHQTLLGYDDRHRLSTVTHQLCTVSTGHACSATSATGSVSYAYDDNDNRTTVNENNGSSSADYRYCYDALNQLTYRNTGAACSSGSNNEAWTYDDGGNRLTATSGGTTKNFAYTAAGALCDVETAPTAASCSGGNVTSDDAGRIATWNGWAFAYDANGRLVSACENSSCAGSGYERFDFTYDGEGHRTEVIETTAGGSATTRTFRYQGDAIVQELEGSTIVRDYVVDATGILTKVIVPAGQTDAGTYLVIWNGHGDAQALWKIDAGTGALTLANSYVYDTWGTPTTTTHNSISDLEFRFLYVGQFDVQWDDDPGFGLGLIYMHARHYAPALGRFLQPDPSRLDAYLYSYASDNPISKVDPDGTFPCLVPVIGQLACLGSAVIWISTLVLAGSVVSWYVRMYNYYWPRVRPIAQALQGSFQATIALAKKLPRTGERPYVGPREGGREVVKPAPGNPGAFVDKRGNIWRWAKPNVRHAGPHWDVTHPRTIKHTNVDSKGKVIGGPKKDNFPFKSNR